MELDIQSIEIWEANIADQPGGLAHALDALDDAGVDIQLIVARRGLTGSGRGQVLITPLRGDHQVAAAARAGFHMPEHIHAIRVSGDNRAGLATGLPGMIARLGINLLGFTASTLGRGFVAYIAADSQPDVDRIVQALRQL
ncbi:amino acid-binding protein [Paraburkholderia guartelaensis]|uniref:amino acid-binding protein n=1 Tax=Paraburkholderia guartelaensis TaxID=2546446 RepID=UPI002AB64AD8|nr:amino acid-binding protein [Paraburkholderia guartelaensis]